MLAHLTIQRVAPSFTPETEEVERRASPGCPRKFIKLALDCCKEFPADRPVMSEVLGRLRDIELEVLARIENPKTAEHVGSVRLLRHHGPRAMPIFEPLTSTHAITAPEDPAPGAYNDPDREDEHAKAMEEEALATLNALSVDGSGASELISTYDPCRTVRWDDSASVIGKDASKNHTCRSHQYGSLDTDT